MAGLIQKSPSEWEAAKILCRSVGIREAARRLGMKEVTLLQRSRRDPTGSWAPPTEQVNASQGRSIQPVITPSAALENTIRDRGNKTRGHLSKATLKASKYLGNQEPEFILAKSQDMNNVARTANLVHGWQDANQQPSGPFNLNLMGGRAVIQVNHSTPGSSANQE